MIKLDRDLSARLVDDLFKVVKRGIINKIGRKVDFVRRRRKMGAFDFLILLVFGSVDSSLLENQASSLPVSMTASGLYYRFTAGAVKLMETCLMMILRHVVAFSEQLKLGALDFCKRILVIDSTTCAVSPLLALLFPGSGGDGPVASYKLQLVLDIKGGKLLSSEITEGRKPDQKYASMLPQLLQPGDLIIQDLGYFNIPVFEAISQLGAYFLSRLRFGSRICHLLDGHQLTLSEILKEQTTDQDVLIGCDDHQIASRLIAIPVPEEVANKRRQKVREDARRRRGKQPSAERLRYCGWTIFITNIPRAYLPFDIVWAIYRLRWQIELFFKVLKSVLNLDKLRTSNPYRLKCHVLGKLILAALLFRVFGDLNIRCWNTSRREVSFERFTKRIAHFAPILAYAFGRSARRAAQSLIRHILHCLNHCLKNRRTVRKTTLQALLSLSGDHDAVAA